MHGYLHNDPWWDLIESKLIHNIFWDFDGRVFGIGVGWVMVVFFRMQCEIISVRRTFVNSGDLLKIDQQNHMKKADMPRWVATPWCHAILPETSWCLGDASLDCSSVFWLPCSTPDSVWVIIPLRRCPCPLAQTTDLNTSFNKPKSLIQSP